MSKLTTRVTFEGEIIKELPYDENMRFERVNKFHSSNLVYFSLNIHISF